MTEKFWLIDPLTDCGNWKPNVSSYNRTLFRTALSGIQTCLANLTSLLTFDGLRCKTHAVFLIFVRVQVPATQLKIFDLQ